MKKAFALFFLSVVLLIAAGLFTFLPLHRYGYHGDSLPCGENPAHYSYYTVTTYMALTRPSDDGPLFIGTCPYESFSANTYALELWLPGILFGYFGYRSRRKSRRTH